LTYNNNIKNKFKINNIIFLIPLTPAPLPQGERGTETAKGRGELKPQRGEGDGNYKERWVNL